MWTIDRVICLGVLLILAMIDIRRRKVPVKILAGSVAGVAVYYLAGYGASGIMVGGGIAVGVFFLLVSRVTNESMGYGDSLGILILGAYMGMWKIIEVLAGAFMILGIFSVMILWIKKMSRGIALPFFPFLAGGYVLVVLAEGGIV